MNPPTINAPPWRQDWDFPYAVIIEIIAKRYNHRIK